VSVPNGLFGTVWAYRRLREVPRRAAARLDWPGNATFALGVVGIMVGITYGIQPYGHSTMGWTSPFVLGCLSGGVALLAAFALIEHQVADPMFRLALFRIRASRACPPRCQRRSATGSWLTEFPRRPRRPACHRSPPGSPPSWATAQSGTWSVPRYSPACLLTRRPS